MFQIVWRDDEGNVVSAFDDMTEADLLRALADTFIILADDIVPAPRTRIFFDTRHGRLSLTIEEDLN